jgi:hypothetical protein
MTEPCSVRGGPLSGAQEMDATHKDRREDDKRHGKLLLMRLPQVGD